MIVAAVMIAFFGGSLYGVAICLGPRWALAVIPLVTVLLCGLLMKPAGAVSWCPTKAEAHRAHPGAWLYWHSAMRCWDDRRSNARHWPLEREARGGGEPRHAQARHKAHAAAPERALIAEDAELEASYWPPLWSDAPIEVSFALRWPDQGEIDPATWLREAYTFGHP
jgi:hypothetical protein